MDRRCRYCEKIGAPLKIAPNSMMNLSDDVATLNGAVDAVAALPYSMPRRYLPLTPKKRLRNDQGAQNCAGNPPTAVVQPTVSSLSRTRAQNLSVWCSPSTALGIVPTHPCDLPQSNSVVETSAISPAAAVHEAQGTHHQAKAISEYEGSCDGFHT